VAGDADPVERLEALLSPLGHELLDRIGRERFTPDTALRLSTSLRAANAVSSRYPPSGDNSRPPMVGVGSAGS